MFRTNSKNFMSQHFPDLLHYKTTTSKQWLSTERANYYDNWWFKFLLSEVEASEFVIFIGALGTLNADFKVFRVPSEYILSNLDNLDMTPNGWINLYVHMESYVDLRNGGGVGFGQFAMN